MGSAAFDKALQDWIDQQTDGLLKEQASGLTMDQETILALASTIYFPGQVGRRVLRSQHRAGYLPRRQRRHDL